MNPETLKQRYGYDEAEGKSFEDLAKSASPSKRKQITDLVSTLEKEAAKASFHKAQNDQLKNVILNLESKLKVKKKKKIEGEVLFKMKIF